MHSTPRQSCQVCNDWDYRYHDHTFVPPPSWLDAEQENRCTCCHVSEDDQRGLVVTFDTVTGEWLHADETLASMLHLHVESSGRDCDGEHGRSSIVRPHDYEGLEEPADAWDRFVRYSIPVFSDSEVSITLDTTADGTRQMRWSRRTDEGYSACEADTCVDPSCAYASGGVYDQYAQMAGY